MAKLSLKAGTTGKLIRFYAEKADGSGPYTGLVYNTSGLTAYYAIEGGASTQITLASGGAVGTWTSGTLNPIDGTNMPGNYELGLPNAVLASGKSVIVVLQGVSNLAQVQIEIELTAVDNQDAALFGLSNVATLAAQTAQTTTLSGLPAGVWAAATRTLSAFAFNPTLASAQSFNNTGQTTSVLATLGTNEDTALARLYAMTDSTPKLTTTALSQAPTGGSAPSAATIASAVMTDVSDTLGADIVAINTNVSALLTKIGSPAGASVSADIATANTAIAGVPAALLDLSNAVETGLTMRQTLRLLTAILAGKASDTSGVYTLKRQDGTTTAITIVHDGLGNRTSITLGTL